MNGNPINGNPTQQPFNEASSVEGAQTAQAKKNVILVGMPGAGKSTLGVVVAKMLGMNFLDVDLEIQGRTGKTLQTLIDEQGNDSFILIENEVLCSVAEDEAVANTVVATGGSAVYSAEGMTRLAETGIVVYLQISFDSLVNHLGDIEDRGVVMRKGRGMDLLELYNERLPLYEQFADVTVDIEGHTIVTSALELANVIRKAQSE